MGVLAIIAILAIAVAFSNKRKAINLQVAGYAFAIQASFAVLVHDLPAGQSALGSLFVGPHSVINYTNYTRYTSYTNYINDGAKFLSRTIVQINLEKSTNPIWESKTQIFRPSNTTG